MGFGQNSRGGGGGSRGRGGFRGGRGGGGGRGGKIRILKIVTRYAINFF